MSTLPVALLPPSYGTIGQLANESSYDRLELLHSSFTLFLYDTLGTYLTWAEAWNAFWISQPSIPTH